MSEDSSENVPRGDLGRPAVVREPSCEPERAMGRRGEREERAETHQREQCWQQSESQNGTVTTDWGPNETDLTRV